MANVNCTVEEFDAEGSSKKPVRSVRATCSMCGHVTESFGTGPKSVARCLVLLRNECPQNQTNYYVRGDASTGAANDVPMNLPAAAVLTYTPQLTLEETVEMKASFSRDQARVVERIKLAIEAGQKTAFLLTGQAGSGKSFVLKYLCGTTPRAVITATTGIAAQLLGGCTIHSFIGLSPHAGLSNDKRAVKRMAECKLLVIDEVSMADMDLLQAIYDRCMEAEHFPAFILSGDFLQLPPVEGNKIFGHLTGMGFQTVTLTSQHRQDDDGFIRVLNDIREGELTPLVRDFITKRLVKELPKDCTNLTSKRAWAAEINQARLIDTTEIIHKLIGTLYRNGKVVEPSTLSSSELERFRFPRELQVRVGARIVMVRNNSPLFVNGSTGRVICFISEKDRLKAFKFGESETAVVAVDPARTTELLAINFEPDVEAYQEGQLEDPIDIDPDAMGGPVYNEKVVHEVKPEEPIADFPPPLGAGDAIGEIVVVLDNGNIVRVGRMEEELRGASGELIATMKQFPMILAWALTSHKSQGMSLDRVGVDLDGNFADGMTYTMISRCRHPEGIFFKGTLTNIRVDYEALAFYRQCVAQDQLENP